MCNLYLIIQLNTFFNNCRTQCSPVNSSTGSHIYIIFKNNVSYLRYFMVFSFFIWRITKPVRTNNSPRMNSTVISHNSFRINSYSCKKNTVVTNGHVITHKTVRINFYVFTYLNIFTYVTKTTKIQTFTILNIV